jgi:hypothetical protein
VVGRASALLALVAALAAYDSLHERLWRASSIWWDVLFISVVVIPASFALVWLVLPLRKARGLLPTAVALGVLTYAFHVAGWHTPENLTKLFAVSLAGFWFLGYFEEASWLVLVALIIPWVDAVSVWRGPTREIVKHHGHVFTALSYAFPLPGSSGAARLGIPDLLFFAVFLAGAARFALRPRWTWLALTASFGVTIAISVWLDLSGLPALPGVALGFLVPNADLLWARLRRARRPKPPAAHGQP